MTKKRMRHHHLAAHWQLYLCLFSFLLFPLNEAFTLTRVGTRTSQKSRHCRYDQYSHQEKQKEQSRSVAASAAAAHGNDEKNGDMDESSDPTALDVIRKCMGETAPERDGIFTQTSSSSSSPPLLNIRPGISGFAVDSEFGFVAILTKAADEAAAAEAGTKTEEKAKKERTSTFVVVSPLDTNEVCSAEALCMVQLSGGMDLATTVLPPDILARLVADELDQCDGASEQIRARVKLLEVVALDGDAENVFSSSSSSSSAPETAPATATTTNQLPPSSPERDAQLEKDLVKFQSSVKKLPGLASCSEEQVLTAMKLHADADGSIDRASFTEVLDTLRRGRLPGKIFSSNNSSGSNSAPTVRFEVKVDLDDEIYNIPVPSVVHALGLSMRYSKRVQVRVTQQRLALGSSEILSRFPTFRPIQELQEDARIMDGFIPSMYVKATAPRADDRGL